MKIQPALLVLSLFLAACSEKSAASPSPGAPAPATEADALAQMKAAIGALRQRPEHQAAEITVQHILVGVKERGLQGVTRSEAEAEQLTAQLYAKIQAGEDFDTLVKNNTNDSHPGIYTLSAGEGNPAARIFGRSEMVGAFGDVGWRLEVGQVGVAPFDPSGSEPPSPFGYHIIQRLK